MKGITAGWVLALFLVMFSIGQADSSWSLQMQYEYDQHRQITRQYWADEQGNVVQPEDKTYAQIRYTFANDTLLVQTEYQDAAGNPANNEYGWSRLQRSYNGVGKVLTTEYTDRDGNLAIGSEGFARQVNTYEGRRLIESFNYGADGNLLRSDRLYAHYATVNKPIPNRSVATRTWHEAYYDADGNLMNNENGIAEIESDYYHDTYLRSRVYKDQDGNTVFNPDLGYASLRKTFDRNFITKVEYFDEHENPVSIVQEMSSEAPRYAKQNIDEPGMATWERNLRSEGKPMALEYASVTYERSKLKNVRTGKEGEAKIVETPHGLKLGIYCSSGVMQNLSYLAEALMKRELRARGEEIDDVSGYVARQFAWSCVQNVRKFAGLVGADEQDVWFAEKCHRIHPDFEDDLMLAAAKRCEADLLVTNDKALLAHAVVPAMSSSDALTLLRELYAG